MDFIEKIILKIRQRFCKHRFIKHWTRGIGYEMRCTKCGKVKIYGSD